MDESKETPATTPSTDSPSSEYIVSLGDHVPQAPDAVTTASAGASNAATGRVSQGKKRSGSTRSSTFGAAVVPTVKIDLDEMVKSMSALKMVPRSVGRKQRLPPP